MIFSELYGAYYNTVADILGVAIDHPLKKGELHEIVATHAFGESILNIEPALSEERWQLLFSDGTTPIKNTPTMPLTRLEKQWLKAVFADPRIRLFTDELPDFPDVEPLFSADDLCVFDRYADGDPYGDERYIQNFRLILDAIKNGYPLAIDAENRKGTVTHMVVMPSRLEYSEKDDKFRLYGDGCRRGGVVNLGRIFSCKPYTKPFPRRADLKKASREARTVELLLVDKRNALERVLLHFAHFEKEAVKLEDNKYSVTLTYDKDDETEMVIRILSFGPMVKVTAPESFVSLIKERLKSQKSCES
ncbi:MAG TPA: WYL domain-containing protein [Clostridiales bacterium]|nr:WYL domain-containing protein [Clostridiales bacterium]